MNYITNALYLHTMVESLVSSLKVFCKCWLWYQFDVLAVFTSIQLIVLPCSSFVYL